MADSRFRKVFSEPGRLIRKNNEEKEMPVAGIVLTTLPKDLMKSMRSLAAFAGLEVHGADGDGNIVVVIDTETLDEMEAVIREINALETILSVGLTYLNTEDEAERIRLGEYTPQIFGSRRHEREELE